MDYKEALERIKKGEYITSECFAIPHRTYIIYDKNNTSNPVRFIDAAGTEFPFKLREDIEYSKCNFSKVEYICSNNVYNNL